VSVILLIEDDEGDVMGVRFKNIEEARAWEDEHEDKIGTVSGCVRIVSRSEALGSSR